MAREQSVANHEAKVPILLLRGLWRPYVNKNAKKPANQGSETDNPRRERNPEDRKPGPTAANVGKGDEAASKEERSDLADAGEAPEQDGDEA